MSTKALVSSLFGAFLILTTLGARAHGDGPDAAGAGGASDDTRPVRTTEPPAASDAKELRLRELQGKIRDLQESRLRDRKSMRETLRQLVSEKKSSSRTLRALREALEKRQTELVQKKEHAEKQSKELADLKTQSRELVARMTKHLDDLAALVESGIPWMRDTRANSIRQARAVLQDEKTDPASALAAIGRVQQEEEALGRLVETGVVEVEDGDSKLAVHGFHLGLLAVIFANDDGSVIGFAQAGQRLEDGLQIDRKNALAVSGYLTAVDILRRRRTPGIVDLVLPALPVRPVKPEDDR